MSAKLKIIQGGKGRYSRTIVAELERGTVNARAGDFNRRMVRRYSTPERAMFGAYRWLMQAGYVKDVITVYRDGSSRIFGTVKVTLKGRIKAEWDASK